MKFAENRPVKIVMLGAGGTGGHIAPHLYRLLYALDRPVRFIICDGDIVEEKNLVRQNFTPADLGENKAKVLAERYSSVFGMETEYVPEFIESGERLLSMLRARTFPTGPYWHSQTVKELVILIGAVDNNKSRKLCHEVFYKLDDLIYIDSGKKRVCGRSRLQRVLSICAPPYKNQEKWQRKRERKFEHENSLYPSRCDVQL